jgi:hypothetical protein
MMSTFRIGSRLLAAAAVLLSLVGLIASAAMAAEGERVLDPRLSLIGGCLKEELDPVEDPGCPATPPLGEHPPALFAFPRAVTTDFHGNLYVANWGKKEDGSEGRIDIFNSEGHYITEIPQGVVVGPQALAVDSAGILYTWSYKGKLLRFDPCDPYDPAAGEIDYCEPPSAVTLVGPDCPSFCENRELFGFRSLAINLKNDHLFFATSGQVVEYASAAEGNDEVRSVHYQASGTGAESGMGLDSVRQKLYLQEGGDTIGIYDLAEGLPAQEEFQRLGSIEASVVPEEHFGSTLALAVDEGTGHLYVYDSELAHLWELEEDGNYVATVEFPFQSLYSTMIAIDNGPFSPNGKLSEEAGKGRYLYVPSHPKKTPSHLFAFFASITGAPEALSVLAANIGEDEAELQAVIDPGNLATTYTFEFKAEGAVDWTQAGSGTLAAGNLDAEVSASAKGLSPGTHYRFRILASNEKGSDEAEGSFATYPSPPAEPSPCSNVLLRTGASALLPDCRAYELVTPPDTNAHGPLGPLAEGGGFTTRLVSPAGDKVPFRIAGGSLPGFNATGSLLGDPYLATRTAAGWSTSLIGPSGAETISHGPGTTSPDQGYSFWGAATAGSAVLEGHTTFYVRYPDGHSELLGQGSLANDPEATGRLISEGGAHIVFTTGTRASSTTAVQLEPEAAPDGTQAIYDRTPDGITHVVSLKPGNVAFGAGEQADYRGASFDGVGIAFTVNGILYLRYNNAETFEVGEGVSYAGVAEGGGRVFYVEDGDLKAFDVAIQGSIEFADAAAEVIPATISADGSTAYFISKSAIPGSGPNPEGAKPKAGGQNLYRSEEGVIAFIGTVTERDVIGSDGVIFDGLGLWFHAIGPIPSGLGEVPARSTPDGGVFLFKSRASLTAYDSQGHAEIYRYDSVAKSLRCLSCNPTGAPARSDATLQSPEVGIDLEWPENLRADGRRAFFESSEPLVARDGDGFQDVYEWEEQGVGSCSQPEGCLYLISSPQSRRDEYLWAVSRSGDDVFFHSPELLVGSDTDETPSIYDARVGGGFAETKQGVCEGEGCRSHLTAPPSLPAGDTPVRGAGDNVKPRRCGKGKRKVKRAGKVRCANKKRHQKPGRHHRRAGAGQNGGR